MNGATYHSSGVWWWIKKDEASGRFLPITGGRREPVRQLANWGLLQNGH